MVKPPIKIMIYVHEINEDFESDSAGKTTVEEEKEDVIGDKVIFSVSYLNVWFKIKTLKHIVASILLKI